MSQPNEITIAYTIASDSKSENFQRFDPGSGNISTYVTSEHTTSLRDMLQWYRTASKPSGNFRGTKKVALKFTVDRSVTARDGSLIIAPEIWQLSGSIPEGVVWSEEDYISSDIPLHRLATLAKNLDLMHPLVKQLMI